MGDIRIVNWLIKCGPVQLHAKHLIYRKYIFVHNKIVWMLKSAVLLLKRCSINIFSRKSVFPCINNYLFSNCTHLWLHIPAGRGSRYFLFHGGLVNLTLWSDRLLSSDLYVKNTSNTQTTAFYRISIILAINRDNNRFELLLTWTRSSKQERVPCSIWKTRSVSCLLSEYKMWW